MIAYALAAAAAVAATQCGPANEAEVRERFQQWVKAYQAHDLADTMAIFSPEVRFEFQGAPDADWTALRQSYVDDFARHGSAAWIPEWDQVLVSGNLAAAFSHWKAVVSNPDGTKMVQAENRSVDVLQRDADCQWRIVRSLNYPLAKPASPAEQ
jgi:uncharacterized protein (TIGR02246 family)